MSDTYLPIAREDAVPNLDLRPLAGPSLASGDPLPAGPYSVGMTWHMGVKAWQPPYTVRAANGRVIAGHIPSRLIAQLIATCLNGYIRAALDTAAQRGIA